MIGRRLNHDDGLDAEPGDYWAASSPRFAGYWTVMTPNGHVGMLNPTVHTITEHADGTITVNPSILLTHPIPGSGGESAEVYHGWLVNGVWREC